MPEELTFLEPGNFREPDEGIRCMLVEVLFLLTTTRHCRDVLRRRKVYPILQKLHLQETSPAVQAQVEQVVDLLARDEGAAAATAAVASVSGIQAVVDSEDEEDMPDMGGLLGSPRDAT